MVRYVPTYSGINYHKFNEINFILPLLIILVTMQTKLGAKINILADRVYAYYGMDIYICRKYNTALLKLVNQ